MNNSAKWIIFFTFLMVISSIISGFFFFKSGLVDFENQTVHKEVVVELIEASFEFNKFFGIPTDGEKCYLDWCWENGEPKA